MGRNFSNKIWNALRFLLVAKNEIGTDFPENKSPQKDLSDRWIMSRLEKMTNEVKKCFKVYKLNEALLSIYDFIWHEYCDWYIELIKERISQENKVESSLLLNKIAIPIFEKAIFLLHPFMPFITEEIWQNLSANGQRKSIMITGENETFVGEIDEDAEKSMKLIQDIITIIRNIRGEMNVPPEKIAKVIIVTKDKEIQNILKNYESYFYRLAKTSEIKVVQYYSNPGISATGVLKDVEIYVPLEELIDIEKEKNRLEKELNKLEYHIEDVNKIEKEKSKMTDFISKYEKIKFNLNILIGREN
jgi:valyl-tRNA synthetase